MGFVAFIFVGLIFTPSGGLERPMVQTGLTMAACQAARAEFLSEAEAHNKASYPAMRTGYAATPCYMAVSLAGSKVP